MIFFDIGSTLLTGVKQSPFDYMANTFGLNPTGKKILKEFLLTKNITSIEEFTDYLVSVTRLQRNYLKSISTEVWNKQLIEPVCVTGGKSLLDELRMRRINYGFISNIWCPFATTFMKLYQKQIDKNEFLFFSHQLGMMKPHDSIFSKAITSSGLKPESCIMVGDSYREDMCQAMNLGMKTVWVITRPEKEQDYILNVITGRMRPPTLIVKSLEELTSETFLHIKKGIIQ